MKKKIKRVYIFIFRLWPLGYNLVYYTININRNGAVIYA